MHARPSTCCAPLHVHVHVYAAAQRTSLARCMATDKARTDRAGTGRAGRLDRKIEFPHPSEDARAKILKIHSRRMNVSPDVNFDELGRSTDDFNAAQLKAVCVEAGMLALRREGTIVNHEDFNEAIIEVQAKKKSHLNYYA
jgi:26S proteasome regulatory subunit T5